MLKKTLSLIYLSLLVNNTRHLLSRQIFLFLIVPNVISLFVLIYTSMSKFEFLAQSFFLDLQPT